MPISKESEVTGILDRYAAFVSPAKVETFRAAGIHFAIGRREGPYIWNADGERRLINCHCNGGVFNLGHRHPAVLETLRAALETLDIGNHHLPSDARARLAARLAETALGGLQYAVFAVGGGEAIDCAIKVARKATGRRRIITAAGGYHGHTGLAVAAGDAKFSVPFLADSPDFVHVPFNDFEALEAAMQPDVAAVLLETIPATLGMSIPLPGYLARIKALCAANGSVYIADEVQTGLGRTGTFWSIEQDGVAPDILVTGKGLSGGVYPIAATLLTPAMEAVFHDDPFAHISTFGGAEAGCAVAEKVIEISSAPAFLKRVRKVSERVHDGLIALQARYPGLVSEIRRRGMFMGVRFHGELGPLMTKCCFDNGLFCVYAANDKSVLQFLPPLIIDDTVADEIIGCMDGALAQAARLLE